ncbi:hypothetical protein CJ030_MR4G027174 [Morella rubra]|uniref:Uncharacterized protein n=1 Tax=Morella rubra TaxID=262757 RepID=A0A6A1VZV7_9ROSI|nr:hypothetical protein CJ030_MR4G027174 [Morella rubra]
MSALDCDADVLRIIALLDQVNEDELHVYPEHGLDIPDLQPEASLPPPLLFLTGSCSGVPELRVDGGASNDAGASSGASNDGDEESESDSEAERAVIKASGENGDVEGDGDASGRNVQNKSEKAKVVETPDMQQPENISTRRKEAIDWFGTGGKDGAHTIEEQPSDGTIFVPAQTPTLRRSPQKRATTSKEREPTNSAVNQMRAQTQPPPLRSPIKKAVAINQQQENNEYGRRERVTQ